MLTTTRLHLRNLGLGDLDYFYQYRNQAECKKYQGWKNTTRQFLYDFILLNQHKTFDDDDCQFAICFKETDQLIGDLYFAKKNKTITLGYTIGLKYQRNGYMYELLSSVIPFIFSKYPDYEICCLVHPDNIASRRLLEKLKFIHEGYLEQMESEVYVLNLK